MGGGGGGVCVKIPLPQRKKFFIVKFACLTLISHT